MVVARTRGSKRVQAQPARRRQQVAVGPVDWWRQRRHEFSGEFQKTEEIGDFNLWSPISGVVLRQQVAVGPADRQQTAVGPPTGGGNADMSFPENSGKRKKLGTLIYGPQFRVLSGGSKWLRALPGGVFFEQSAQQVALLEDARLFARNQEAMHLARHQIGGQLGG